jgi:hypothetical protein
LAQGQAWQLAPDRSKDNPNVDNFIKMQEQCSQGCPNNGNIPGLTYRSQTVNLFSNGRNKNATATWRAVMSHVTGSHSTRFGYIGNQLGDLRLANVAPNNLQYRVNNGVPNLVTMFINNFLRHLRPLQR